MHGEPKSTKGRTSRTRLLAAAKTVFERQGFLTATISDITAEAEMSHGSFYHYFPSKEAIFREIAEAVEGGLLGRDEVAEDPRSERPARKRGSRSKATADPLESIRAANRSYLLAYQKEARIMRVIEEVSRYDDEVRAVRTRRDEDLTRRLEVSLSRLQKQGRADVRIDGRYSAMALGGMVARFAEQMFLDGGKYDVDESVDQLTLLWANAIGLPVESWA